MDNKSNFLISDFKIYKNQMKNTHTSGKLLNFSRPVLGYIKKGYAKFLYKGITFYANEGDLIYIALGTQYYSVWFGEPEIEWFSINFEFISQRFNYEYRFQILKDFKTELFEKIYESYVNEPFLATAYFYELLSSVYGKLTSEDLCSQRKAIKPAIDYIEGNYSKEISIPRLAELTGYSEASVYKLFKMATGVTPITYKHNIMIQHSLDLLKNSDLSIEEIARSVGFSSSNYFRKIFVKLTGRPPKDIRKS